MAQTTLRLDKRRPLKDGTYPIQIVVGYGTNMYLSTGLYSTAEDWNTIARQSTGRNAKRLNAVLQSMVSNICNRIYELKETGQWKRLTRPQIRQMLTDLDLKTPTVGRPSVGEAIAKMTEGRRENTKNIARNAVLKLNKFCGDINNVRFEDLSRAWLEDFYDSMPDMSINTKAGYMRVLRRAVNWALDRDITTNNPFRTYRIPQEETRMRVLPIEKMRQLLSLNELEGMYTEYRDMFMLTFYLIGINTVDLSSLTEENIVNGRLEYRRAKTNKLYSVKIEPEAMDIIERYRGKNCLIRCFDRYKDYKALQGSVNNALSKIGQPARDASGNYIKTENRRKVMEPLEKDLSLYWARYSWATYAADLDIPKDTISEALGHSHGARVTGIYIKYSRDKVDAANRKVIDYVLGKLDNP